MNRKPGIMSRLFGTLTSVVFVVAVLTLWDTPLHPGKHPILSASIIKTAHADDDEHEYEDKDDRESSDSSSSSSSSPKTTETRYVTHYEVRQVPQTMTVIPEEYQKDTDGDKLVDAIDPDPLTSQQAYFTDTDGDGVSNAFDKHHDEDDFAYFDSEYDTNNDGIIDSFEQLAEQ